MALAREGIASFPHDTPLYIRPMFWAESGLIADRPRVDPVRPGHHQDAAARPGQRLLALPVAVPAADPEQAPTHTKAACLYPLAGLAIADAKRRGFDNAVMCDPIGNVAELTAQNIMIVKDGVVLTPVPNGTFLNGITRQRVIGLLRDAGVEVVERTIRAGRAARRRRDLLHRQPRQGRAVPALRVQNPGGRSDLSPGARTLLGVRPPPRRRASRRPGVRAAALRQSMARWR